MLTLLRLILTVGGHYEKVGVRPSSLNSGPLAHFRGGKPIWLLNGLFKKSTCSIASKHVTMIVVTGCGAVGSALRLGRRGRRFESGHPDCMDDAAVVQW
jgi:hypothetical protein